MTRELILSIAATSVFLCIRIIQSRLENKEDPKVLKSIISDTCIVFLSVFMGDFLLNQLSHVDALSSMLDLSPLSGGGGSQPKAFTNKPKF